MPADQPRAVENAGNRLPARCDLSTWDSLLTPRHDFGIERPGAAIQAGTVTAWGK